jgi:hypothetical protein
MKGSNNSLEYPACEQVVLVGAWLLLCCRRMGPIELPQCCAMWPRKLGSGKQEVMLAVATHACLRGAGRAYVVSLLSSWPAWCNLSGPKAVIACEGQLWLSY